MSISTMPQSDLRGVLPVKDDWGFFGVRFESIGGYGAHIAGRMLAEAGVMYMGLNGSNFSSYGSEKKGSPVKAYVRFCDADHAVRTSAPVEEPHVICVFHEGLIGKEPVASGLRTDGILIANSRKSPEEMRRILGLEYGTIITVDAISVAVAEKSRVNMVMLGALCRAVPFLQCDALRHLIADTFGKKYPATVPGNLRAFERGYAEGQFLHVETAAGFRPPEFQRPGPAYGYLNAPIGGQVVNPGNTILKDLSASRQGWLPDFNREKCTDCGQCDLVCPDYCFVWEQSADKRGRPAMSLRGIDYQYCKGCLKCVDACPFDALHDRLEEEGWAREHGVRHAFAADRG